MCPLVLPLLSPSLRGRRRFALALAGCPLLPTTSGTLRNGTPAAASLGDRNPLRWHRGLHFRRCPRAAGAPRRRGPPPWLLRLCCTSRPPASALGPWSHPPRGLGRERSPWAAARAASLLLPAPKRAAPLLTRLGVVAFDLEVALLSSVGPSR